MKHLLAIACLIFSASLFSQTANPVYVPSEHTKAFLSADSAHQKLEFLMKYGFGYYSVNGTGSTNGKPSLQIGKPDILDTIRPFYNTVTVTDATLAMPMQVLKTSIQCGLMNSEFFSEGKNIKAFERKLEVEVTGFPYKEDLKISMTLTSVTDANGKNVLVDGRDTLVGQVSKSGGKSYCYPAFTFDNTGYPETLTIT